MFCSLFMMFFGIMYLLNVWLLFTIMFSNSSFCLFILNSKQVLMQNSMYFWVSILPLEYIKLFQNSSNLENFFIHERERGGEKNNQSIHIHRNSILINFLFDQIQFRPVKKTEKTSGMIFTSKTEVVTHNTIIKNQKNHRVRSWLQKTTTPTKSNRILHRNLVLSFTHYTDFSSFGE